MKKVILGLALAALIVSCKKETEDKVEDATEAVGTEMEQTVDTAMVKTENAMDAVKAKTDTLVKKSAEKVEKTAKEVKESKK